MVPFFAILSLGIVGTIAVNRMMNTRGYRAEHGTGHIVVLGAGICIAVLIAFVGTFIWLWARGL